MASNRHFTVRRSLFGESDGSGHDLVAYGNTPGKHLQWTASTDTLEVNGVTDLVGTFKLNGDTVTATAAQLNSVSAAIQVANKSGGSLTKGTLVYINGYDTTLGAPTVAVADATQAATHVLTETIANNAAGVADGESLVTGLNTSAFADVGAAVYLGASAGAVATAVLTGADQIAQVVGVVVTKHASTGSIRFFPGLTHVAALGTRGLQHKAVTNVKLADLARGSVKVGGASNAVTDLDAKTAGQILVGDGTDLKSVAVSGDVTLSATGEVSIAAGAVEEVNLAFAVDDETVEIATVGEDEILRVKALGIDTTELADDAVTTPKVADGAITAAKLADGAGVAALLTAGLGASAVVAHDDGDSPVALLAANGPADGDRAVLIVATCITAQAGTVEATFEIGQTGATAKFLDNTDMAAAVDGDVLISAGILTEQTALLVTFTEGTAGGEPEGEPGAGEWAIAVLALPTSA